MKFKPKRWHKIVKISIACIVAVLILLNTLLTNYLRKNIEKTYSALLNAEVSIENLRINYFNGTIKVFNILITGKNEFKNDTLLIADKLVFAKPEYDKTSKNIVISEMRIVNLKMNNIISQNGNSCWNIEKNNKLSEDEEDLSSFDIFVKAINVENSELLIINRKNNEIQSFTNINLKMNLHKQDLDIISDFNAGCTVNTKDLGNKKLSLSGNSKYSDKKIEAEATFKYDEFPVEIEICWFTDSLSEENSFIKLKTDFAKLQKQKDIETKGNLEIELISHGIFNRSYDFNFQLNVKADSISFVNHKNNASLRANFITKISYDNSGPDLFNFISNDIFLMSGTDTLKGFMDFRVNDTLTLVNSDLKGSFDSEILNLIYEDITFLTDFKISTTSSLKGKIDNYKKDLLGEYITNIEINSPGFNVPELQVSFIKDKFSVETFIVSDIITGKIDYCINEIQNLYNQATVKHNLVIDISKLSIPDSDGSTVSYMPDIDQSRQFKFPQKTETAIIINIDSIQMMNKVLQNLHSKVILSPDKFGIYILNLDIGTGRLNGEFSFNKESEYLVSNSSLIFDNMDLAYFADFNTNISGVLNIDLKNTVYSVENEIEHPKNNGVNKIRIEGFRLHTGLLKSYEINEDYLTIGNTEIIAILEGDSLIVKPAFLTINDANVKVIADYNIITDSIMVSALFDIPDSYLSSKIKLLISLFASDSNLKIPKDKDRSTYLLKISGLIDDLEYNIYE
ncbi:MAG TPA: hypothetical protein PKN32_12160 [Bacteroidales bacterium]|nr:hypothetical protein [Bacteroidales bacterium]